MCELGMGGCLADDMGLGKTIQVIALQLARGRGPMLVICPASLLGNWARELHTFAPSLRVRRYHGEGRNLEGLEKMPALLSSLHAAEHSMIALLPLWAMCDRWDIGGLSTNVHYQTGSPTVFVYDGHPGGVGIAERGFVAFEGWVADTAKMLAGCPCSDGCPSCVQSPKCGNLNEWLDKQGALTVLRRMLAAG